MLALEARTAYNSREYRSAGQTNREIVITVLQFFVGGLVTVGGAAFVTDGIYPVGTILGLIHLAVGFTGLFAGYVFLRKKAWSRKLLIAINGLTIAYSAFSESAAQIFGFLPPGVNDSLTGTLIAIIISGTIVYLLRRRTVVARISEERR